MPHVSLLVELHSLWGPGEYLARIAVLDPNGKHLTAERLFVMRRPEDDVAAELIVSVAEHLEVAVIRIAALRDYWCQRVPGATQAYARRRRRDDAWAFPGPEQSPEPEATLLGVDVNGHGLTP